MSLKEKLIILAAPLAVIFEWVTMIYVLNHFSMDLNQPISTLPYYHPDARLLFGIVLSVVAVLFSIFSLALTEYWKPAFKFTLFCSAVYLMAGWSLYDPVNQTSLSSVIHAGAANFAALGYTFLIFQISQRSHGMLRQASKVFFKLAVLFMVGVTLSIHVFHDYAAWFQILVLLTAQAWVLCASLFLWKQKSTPSLD